MRTTFCDEENPDVAEMLRYYKDMLEQAEVLLMDLTERADNTHTIMRATDGAAPGVTGTRAANLDTYYSLVGVRSGDMVIIHFPAGCDHLRPVTIRLTDYAEGINLDCTVIMTGNDTIASDSNVLAQLRLPPEPGNKASLYVIKEVI